MTAPCVITHRRFQLNNGFTENKLLALTQCRQTLLDTVPHLRILPAQIKQRDSHSAG